MMNTSVVPHSATAGMVRVVDESVGNGHTDQCHRDNGDGQTVAYSENPLVLQEAHVSLPVEADGAIYSRRDANQPSDQPHHQAYACAALPGDVLLVGDFMTDEHVAVTGDGDQGEHEHDGACKQAKTIHDAVGVVKDRVSASEKPSCQGREKVQLKEEVGGNKVGQVYSVGGSFLVKLLVADEGEDDEYTAAQANNTADHV